MKLSVLVGATFVGNGLFVLGRPLSTRQVIGGWNPSSDWTGMLPKLPLPNFFDGYQMAYANPDAPAKFQSPADTVMQGDVFSPSSDFESPPMADTPYVRPNTLPITGSPNLMTVPVIDSTSAKFPEFDKGANIYCIYLWSSQTQTVKLSTRTYDTGATQGCGSSSSWEKFRDDFDGSEPGYVIYKDPKLIKYYSITNLINSMCQKTNRESGCSEDHGSGPGEAEDSIMSLTKITCKTLWDCSHDSTSAAISEANPRWLATVAQKVRPIQDLGQVNTDFQLQQVVVGLPFDP